MQPNNTTNHNPVTQPHIQPQSFQTSRPKNGPKNKRPKQKKYISLLSAILISTAIALTFSLFTLLTSFLILKDNSTSNLDDRRQIISTEGEVFNQISQEVGKSVVSIISTDLDGQQTAGSGVVINDNGLILTNKHVVNSIGASLTVIDHNNREYTATVLGRDSANDIAFISVRSNMPDVPSATLANSSEIKVGDKVLAIGNALGEFQNTVTSGIVSGVGRPVEISDDGGFTSEVLFNLIQTDAAINPGNSGGPLVNLKGEVIGINTAIVENAQSLGFSIPVNDIKPLIAQIEETGNLGERAYLGVRYLNLTADIATDLDILTDEGALIYSSNSTAVEAGSPADIAGLQDFDVIKAIDGNPINDNSSLSSVLAKFSPGQAVELTIFRDTSNITLQLTLGAIPN